MDIYDTSQLCPFFRKVFNDMSAEEEIQKAKACAEDVYYASKIYGRV
jgi:hypothetical protein